MTIDIPAPAAPASKLTHLAALMVATSILSACGGNDTSAATPAAAAAANVNPAMAGVTPPPAAPVSNPPPAPTPAPVAAGSPVGYSAGNCAVPAAAQAKNTTQPLTVVGNGSAASCTSAAVVAAVAQGGVVTFDCGADPVTIRMSQTARIFNNKPDLVLDGGGKVTLSGDGARRILYQNTCDANQVYMSARCDLDDSPRTTVQNITLADGNSTGQNDMGNYIYGGGAMFARGGRLSIVNTRFVRNQCESTGPDLGGGALRLFQMSKAAPVTITNSTFGGTAADGNFCSNGGAISSLDQSVSVYNSLVTHNRAVGYGRNPQAAGTPGGGNGGALYNDGDTFNVSICGSMLQNNQARELGGAIAMVSNNRAGGVQIDRSWLIDNPNVPINIPENAPGVFVLAAPGHPVITNSTIR